MEKVYDTSPFPRVKASKSKAYHQGLYINPNIPCPLISPGTGIIEQVPGNSILFSDFADEKTAKFLISPGIRDFPREELSNNHSSSNKRGSKRKLCAKKGNDWKS